jgi:heptaprenyl diphosphate synthase
VTDEQLHDWISDLSHRVESRLLETVRTPNSFVEEAARYLVDAGGKMFRPAFVLAAGGLGLDTGTSDEDSLVSAAVVVELTHVASLYHDDVMDEAVLRRGAPTAHTKWDNSVAIMVGDYMLAQASILSATLGTDFVAYQGLTLSRLVQGQIAEMRGPDTGIDEITHHLDVIRGKTAALINAAARYGATFAGLEADRIEALTTYGENVGIAFQLADDLLDIASSNSGKVQGTDLREGVPTLTTLLVKAHARSEDARLLELLRSPVPEEEIPEALALLRVHPALAEAKDEVRQWAKKAEACLDGFPDVAATRALRMLCEQAVERTK